MTEQQKKIYLAYGLNLTAADTVIHPGETLLSKLSEEELRSLFDLT